MLNAKVKQIYKILKILLIIFIDLIEIPPECHVDDDCGLERICLKQKCIGNISLSFFMKLFHKSYVLTFNLLKKLF